MSEWDWVGLFALVGVSFLLGRWDGIRAFGKEMERVLSLNKALEDDDDD